MVIGITGGTGCGKTTALRAFQSLGGYVVDCDRLYHRLLQEDKALQAAIAARFPQARCPEGIDRQVLGTLVFSDPQALSHLNAITHPAVFAAVKALLREHPGDFAVDAIGLFEGGLNTLCRCTVGVTAPEEVRAARLTARDGISEQRAKMRIAAQKSQKEIAQRCDFILENNGTEQEFFQKARSFFENLLKENGL